MNDTSDLKSKGIPMAAKMIIFLGVILVVAAGVLFGSKWIAQGSVERFCNTIQPGHRISLVLAAAEEQELAYWGDPDPLHLVFYAPGSSLNKSYCGVTVGENGKVIAVNPHFLPPKAAR